MPYPLSQGKHAAPSATDPAAIYEEDDALPATDVLCFQPPVYEYAKRIYDGAEIDRERPRHSIYRLAVADGRVGAVGDIGIGGPAAARVAEELIARGVETFVVLGHAASLQRDIEVSDVVVVDSALRDEGTSYHYLEPDRSVEASSSVMETLTDAMAGDGAVHVGSTWTIDAIFRETVPEIERYAAEGVLTVDMEAASLFAVARHRGVDVGAAFVVSDYVGPEEWSSHLDETWPHLERRFDQIVEAFAPGG